MTTGDNNAQGVGPYGRLDELSRIKNDFEAELQRQPTPGQGGGRREQLSRDHTDVMNARRDEVLRLMKEEGKTPDEISMHPGQTGPTREAQPSDPEAEA
jgi:hypothetical protein